VRLGHAEKVANFSNCVIKVTLTGATKGIGLLKFYEIAAIQAFLL